jgi:hypothetical protein
VCRRFYIGKYHGFRWKNQGNSIGEKGQRVLRGKFDGKLKLEFHGVVISSDVGFLVYHELGEALGLTVDLKA